VIDRLTLVLQLAGQQVSLDNNGLSDTASGLSASRAGLQVRLLDYRRWTVSAQAAAIIPGGGENVADRPLGDGANGLEVRALAGRSIGEHGFLDLQWSQTWRDDNYPSEQRFDATLGWRWRERWIVMGQSFLTHGDSDLHRSIREFRQHKLQFSVGRRIGPGRAVLGFFTTVSGRNSVDESGLVISWWRRF